LLDIIISFTVFKCHMAIYDFSSEYVWRTKEGELFDKWNPRTTLI
jgi:hypothetical protein